MHAKRNLKKEESFNPCNVKKIMLIDDDTLCNFGARSMIEASGRYQVFSFYNGADVNEKLILIRLRNSMRIEVKKLVWLLLILKCLKKMELAQLSS